MIRNRPFEDTGTASAVSAPDVTGIGRQVGSSAHLHTLKLSSFRQTGLTPATDTDQRIVGTTDLANHVLTTAVEARR